MYEKRSCCRLSRNKICSSAPASGLSCPTLARRRVRDEGDCHDNEFSKHKNGSRGCHP